MNVLASSLSSQPAFHNGRQYRDLARGERELVSRRERRVHVLASSLSCLYEIHISCMTPTFFHTSRKTALWLRKLGSQFRVQRHPCKRSGFLAFAFIKHTSRAGIMEADDCQVTSFHGPTAIPPSALNKPSIMKRYHRTSVSMIPVPGT